MQIPDRARYQMPGGPMALTGSGPMKHEWLGSWERLSLTSKTKTIRASMEKFPWWLYRQSY